MTPLRLSHTWSQRLFVGLFTLSFAYIAVYILEQMEIIRMPATAAVNIVALAGAVLVALGSIAGFVFVKKIRSFLPTYALFIVFALTTAYLISSTGGFDSSYLALWAILAFVAGVFGAFGWLPIFIFIGVFTAANYLGGDFSGQQALIIIVSGILPLIAGAIIWRDPPGLEDASAKNVKHLASQLSEVATKSEIVINAIGDGVIAVDGKGIIQLINPAAQEILGWGKQDALMLNYQSILKLTDENNNDVDTDADPIETVLNTNQKARNNDLVTVTQSGKKINIALVVSPSGNPGSGAIAVFRDITNERSEEREQAEFISTASHEMRTPVASIEGYLGLAMNPNTATVDARGHDYIMKAHEAAQHLGRLFQDLLDVSKSEDGRLANNPKVVDLVPYTQTIVQGLTQKAADKNLELIFKPTDGDASRKIMPVYYVHQDNDHIREVLDNLIENAIKYTLQGQVVVDIAGTEEHVTISIKDTGLGIPPEDVPHLFQKFYRVNNMDRQEIGGTGLGLYLVRRLAEAMQGRVWVESTFGEGSTFYFELPRVSTQEATHLQEEDAKKAVAQRPTAPASPVISIPVVDMNQPSQPAAGQPVVPQLPPTSAPQVPVQPGTAAMPQPVVSAPVTAPVLAPMPQTVAPAPIPTPLQPLPTARTEAPVTPTVRPATTVPRGESLTREQISERVKQLEQLAQQQRQVPPSR